ncbi:hypothetical protein [Alicyclobacillus acidiphilus]|uniref:hypothetical protein n=1 Tax=Alicyclobacillus acidiphilus TaxID=182455 RepID=UPI000836BC99|nr:hypothetical protein [Alicyclobacillus acidiphilus]
MTKREPVRSFRSRTNQADERMMMFVRLHGNFMLAIGVVGLAVWGAISNHPSYIFGLAFAGASAYVSGLVCGLCISMLYLCGNVVLDPGHLFAGQSLVTDIGTILLQVIGYLAVVFLGYKHKTLREFQKAASKANQVLPWAVVNEVRTSLSAIRFLLFPLQDDTQSREEIQKATSELSRLEQLFHDLERNRNQK